MASAKDMEFAHIQAGIFDLNGVLRGKRLPASSLAKVQKSGFAMPLSVQNVDFEGADIDGSPLVFETGDRDGYAVWTGRRELPVTWLDRPSALLPMVLHNQDKSPFDGCPRTALSRMLDQLADANISPCAGFELEFMILTHTGVPVSDTAEILSLSELDQLDNLLKRIETASQAQAIGYDSITSEAGAGQFELVFSATSDLVKLAEDVLLMKHLISSEAAALGYQASFAAKPILDQPGNGLHLHLSLQMADGTNLFAADELYLKQAIAGVLAVLPEVSLIMSPFPDSYARLMSHSHAPTSLSWGYDNRTVAVRVPNSDAQARRMEIRPASAAANPFLFLLVILAAATEGMGLQLAPPAPVEGDSYKQDLPQLPKQYDEAVAQFAKSEKVARYLPKLLFDMFLASKQQDGRKAAKQEA